MVDRYFVMWAFFAVLYHRVSSFSGESKCLLIESDIMLTSPRHAHGMITELVFFDGVDFVDLNALGACSSSESLRACAGVRC
jgi:hypothetical protein